MIDETLISFIWEKRLLPANLLTVNNKTVVIYNTGTSNFDQGPDFLNAKICIDSTVWVGNVEIHVMASDWFRHHHQNDVNYANVICHVVWKYDADTYFFENDNIPTVELYNLIPNALLDSFESLRAYVLPVPCAKLIENVPKNFIYNMLNSCFFEMLDDKISYFYSSLSDCTNNVDEMCYRLIVRNFGFKINNDAFESTAHSLPFIIINKYCSQPSVIESLIFGQANLLSAYYHDDYPKFLYHEYLYYSKKHKLKPQTCTPWKLLRLHPANFPCIRLAQLAAFLSHGFFGFESFIAINELNDYYSIFTRNTNDYWTNNVMFDKPATIKNRIIGKSSVDILLINAVVPFLYYYGKTRNLPALCDKAIYLIESISSENNNIIRMWKSLGINATNAIHSQALIFLKREYCDKRHCLQCKIGTNILTSSVY